MTAAFAPPDGFALSTHASPFLERLGPLYESGDGENYRLGLVVAPFHTNRIGQCHGAVLAALADVHLLRMIALTRSPRPALVTVHLGLDFLAAAKEGAWLEAYGRIDRMGRRLCHSSGVIAADNEPVLRATGVFQIVSAVPKD